MYKYSTALLLLLAGYGANAQEQPDYMQLAGKRFARYEYAMAAPLYEKMATQNKAKPDVYYKLGTCYDEMQQYDKAADNYKTFLSKDTAANSFVCLRLGDVLRTEQHYDEAKSAYALYDTKIHDKSVDVKGRISSCDSAISWQREEQQYNVYNESAINSGYADWGATVYNNQVIFASEDHKDVLDKKDRKGKRKYGWTGKPHLKLYAAISPAQA